MNFTFDITDFIVSLIVLLFTYIIKKLCPLINQKKEEIKQNTSETQYQIILTVCDTAVRFAQQWYYNLGGKEKKDKAIEYVKSELAARGIEFDEERISSCIEAAVQKIKLELKSVEPIVGVSETQGE